VRNYLFFVSQNYSYAILRPLQAAIIARGDQVAWFLFGNDINYQYLKDEERRLFNVSDIFDYDPQVTFVPGNMIPSFMPGLKVAVFHGFNSEKRNNGHFNIRGCFDLYCTQGPSTTTKFKELAQKFGYFNVAETGWPTLDPLFKSKVEKSSERQTVLMCSTFTQSLSCAPHLFEQVKKLSRSGRWQWLIQFHPKMDSEIVKLYKELEGEHLTFVETDDVIPLLQQADVMLCDTSSVLLMFILQGKPVVTFKNNKPGPYLIDFDQPDLLEQHLVNALSRPAPLMAEIEAFNQQLHPYRDGNSSVRVLDAVEAVLTGNNPLPKRKPLNVVRNFKLRKELNYWKFL